MTIIWCMVHEIRSATERIFVILNHLLLFYPPNNPKTQIFEKVKKTFGYIIILQMFTINGNHIMNGSWNMERDRETFLSLRTIFCFFCSNDPKNQNYKKNEKTAWRYHHFTHVHQKLWSHDVPFLKDGARRTDGKSDK